ncbi:MAG: hypothetical protein AMXMBFR58_29530 [Phycisphaerae bacterium]
MPIGPINEEPGNAMPSLPAFERSPLEQLMADDARTVVGDGLRVPAIYEPRGHPTYTDQETEISVLVMTMPREQATPGALRRPAPVGGSSAEQMIVLQIPASDPGETETASGSKVGATTRGVIELKPGDIVRVHGIRIGMPSKSEVALRVTPRIEMPATAYWMAEVSL